IDLDATLVTAHSEREHARATFKNGFGFPLLAFADHGPDGRGAMLTCLLRPDNAGSNTAAGDNAQTVADARGDGRSAAEEGAAQDRRRRVDQGAHRGAGETPSVVIGGLHPARQHPGALPDHPRATPAPAYGPDGTPRQGADVAELTGLLDLGE